MFYVLNAEPFNSDLIRSHLKNRKMVQCREIKDFELAADISAVALSELWRDRHRDTQTLELVLLKMPAQWASITRGVIEYRKKA